MKKLIILLYVFISYTIAWSQLDRSQLENNQEHTVQKDETINSVAVMYDVAANEIIELNDLWDYDPDAPLIGEEAEYEVEILLIPLSSVYYQFPFDINIGGEILDFADKNWPGYYGQINMLIQLPWIWEYALDDDLYLWPIVYADYNFNDQTTNGQQTIKQLGLSWQTGAGVKLQSVDYYLSALAKYGQASNQMSIASGFANKYYYQSLGTELEGRIYTGRNERDFWFSDVGLKLAGMFIVADSPPQVNWRYQPLSHNLLAHYISLQGDFALLDLPIYHWLISLNPNMRLTWANFDSGSAQNYYSVGTDLKVYISGLQVARLFGYYQFGQIERPLIGAEFNLGAIIAKAAGY